MSDISVVRSVTDRLGEWAATLDLDHVPAPVVHQAKRSLVDLIGVALAGSAVDTAGIARDLAASEDGTGPARLWGDRRRAPAPGAAFANAVAAHVLDYDDTCYAGIVHGSAVVAPAALAAAEHDNASGADFLTAFIAGLEVECALGKALTDSLYYKGWFNTAVLGRIGAAAAAARALRIPPAAAGHALALATLETGGLKAGFGTQAKPYLAGRAAEGGVRAALAAARGLSGPANAFEETRGLVRVFNDGVFEPKAVARLGRTWSLRDPGIALKLYPVCSAAQAAAEATAALLREHGLTGEGVAHVTCEVTRLVRISLTYDRPASPAEAQFSLPFAVGCILAYGGIGIERLSGATLADPVLRAAMAKVEMAPWTDADADATLVGRCPEGAVVTLRTVDGRVFRRTNCAATGMPSNPMSDPALAAKFRACAKAVLDPATAGSLLERIGSVERLTSAAELLAPA